MPAFEYDPKDRSRPFMHTNVAGDMTKQPYMDSMAEQGEPGSNMRILAKALAKRKMERNNAVRYAKTGEAAKARGEMGYNPSGTQGAKGSEAKYMNTAVYGKRSK